jgi:hypothetical protein
MQYISKLFIINIISLLQQLFEHEVKFSVILQAIQGCKNNFIF